PRYNPNALHLIDIRTEKEIARIPLAKTWNGIAWAPNGQRVYVAGGIANGEADVYVVENSGGEWKKASGLKLTGAERMKTAIAGLAISSNGKTLYALNNSDNHLYAFDTDSGSTLSRTPVGDHPVSCRLSGDGRKLYVA